MFWKMCGFKKSRLIEETGEINLRIRIRFCLVFSKRRRRPWQWRSFFWRAQCMWQHLWSRFQGKLWGLLEFLRRSVHWFFLHHHDAPDGGWLASWFLGCCHEEFFGDAWHLLFPIPFLLFLVQSFWFSKSSVSRRRSALNDSCTQTALLPLFKFILFTLRSYLPGTTPCILVSANQWTHFCRLIFFVSNGENEFQLSFSPLHIFRHVLNRIEPFFCSISISGFSNYVLVKKFFKKSK